MSKHRAVLRNYVLAVTRELVARSAIRAKAGDSLENTLRQEASLVLAEVGEDFKTVLAELGLGAASAGSRLLDTALQAGAVRLGSWIQDSIADALRGRRR